MDVENWHIPIRALVEEGDYEATCTSVSSPTKTQWGPKVEATFVITGPGDCSASGTEIPCFYNAKTTNGRPSIGLRSKLRKDIELGLDRRLTSKDKLNPQVLVGTHFRIRVRTVTKNGTLTENEHYSKVEKLIEKLDTPDHHEASGRGL